MTISLDQQFRSSIQNKTHAEKSQVSTQFDLLNMHATMMAYNVFEAKLIPNKSQKTICSCIYGYSLGKNLSESLYKLCYRIKEAILNIFGCSEKQHALESLKSSKIPSCLAKIILNLLISLNDVDDQGLSFSDVKNQLIKLYSSMQITTEDIK